MTVIKDALFAITTFFLVAIPGLLYIVHVIHFVVAAKALTGFQFIFMLILTFVPPLGVVHGVMVLLSGGIGQ